MNEDFKEVNFVPKEINDLDKLKFGEDENWLNGCITGCYFERIKRKVKFGINLQLCRCGFEEKRMKIIEIINQEFGNKFKCYKDWYWLELSEFELSKTDIKENIEKDIKKYCNIINKN